MYSSRGNDGYGRQQPYSSQSSYASQSLGGGSLLGGAPQESELGGYMGHGRVHEHPSVTAAAASQPSHYLGQYSSVYGSAAQQVSPMGVKGSLAAGLEGRSNYVSSITDSPKFAVSEHVSSSSRGYGQKVDELYSDRISEYPSSERHKYSECHSAYLGRDLPSETASRYTDSVAFGHEHQMYDLEQATLFRQEQMLKAHGLQSTAADAGVRQSDYLSARGTVHHPAQDPIIYGARVDPESRNLLMTNGSSYGGHHASSILGAAPRRNVDDLLYAQSSSNPGYGVSLPPGRDYGAGKGLHAAPPDLDYPSSMSGHISHLRVDDRKDDRGAYARELERRDKDRDYLRDREKDREREERLRERERERDKERKRDRKRERDRIRKRERARERERERERERDRREKEKDQEQKRGTELKRDLTPSRASRDRRGSSLAKDIKLTLRESPRREVIHRPHSPVKEKRREYVCKIFSYNYVDSERDYLSLDKRYPKLYISPECSKVVVRWRKSNLHLSLYTPVSFEHDFVEEPAKERKGSPSKHLDADISKAGLSTVWNAKVILMSGLSQNALAELSSERAYDDRIPHFCNMLRFAVLKKNNSLMAIGGPWDSIDGEDPLVDESSLIRTALRHAKDVTNLDLKDCLHWNRFLEIHYHRVGKDGLFSHREVTVFYVPDLSECLPSLDSWRDQWLNHKKAVSEREHQQALKKEVAGVEEERSKDKKKKYKPKDDREITELQKKKLLSSSAQSGDGSKNEEDANKLKGEGASSSKEENETNEVVNKKDVIGTANEDKMIPEGISCGQTNLGVKPGTKKIIRRVVKKKVATKKDSSVNATEKNDVDKEGAERETDVDKHDGLSVNSPSIKTFVRKKIVKKLAKSAPEKGATPEVKSEDAAISVKQLGSTKTTVKKKVIKRVPKRKAAPADSDNKLAEDDQMGEKIIVEPEHNLGEHSEEAAGKQQIKEVFDDKISSKKKQDTDSSEKDKKEDKFAGTKESTISVLESSSEKQKVRLNEKPGEPKEKEELKDKKERKYHAENNESRSKASKVGNEKKKYEEPPRHPGLFIQTKGSKDSKLQSLSLSLDSLLDYNDTDIDESTFELSLFAETLYEMLQYKMGCRLLDFLQKLRIKFVTQRKQSKRHGEETSLKNYMESSSSKRAKTDVAVKDVKSTELENVNGTQQDDSNNMKEDIVANKFVNEVKIENGPSLVKEIQDEIDEEDPEEDEEMPEATDSNPHHDSMKEATAHDDSAKEARKKLEVVKADGDDVGEDEDVNRMEKNEQQETEKQTSGSITNFDRNDKDKVIKVKSEPKGTPGAIDKKLLQAFRFFDRNRAGYIRVEDLRLIIHNLGKFLAHRDVKELVLSALLESNTGRDDRILYDKLVKMSDVSN